MSASEIGSRLVSLCNAGKGEEAIDTLYDEKIATFEADDVYDQSDATGFIRLQALRLRTLGAKRISEGE